MAVSWFAGYQGVIGPVGLGVVVGVGLCSRGPKNNKKETSGDLLNRMYRI